MKRAFKISVAVIVALSILIQFVPRDHNESGDKPVNDVSKVLPIQPGVQAVLKRSCYDCHSNTTIYPFYARIQPVRYIMDRHIRQGKEELNFNEFGTYSFRKQRSKLRAISESLEEGSMPLFSYTLIHRSAILSKEDKALLMNWVKLANDSLLQKN
jgi:hypothetical protein